jgi:AraC-like DNA-binding protein
MTSPLPTLPSLSLPKIHLVEASGLPVRVEPLALVTPLEGEGIAIVADERFRLRTGELLVLRGGPALRLERATPAARVAWFEAQPAWVEAFRALHGESETAAPRELDLVPAGATLARRATQLFVSQRLAGAGGEAHVSAATSAALLELAHAAQGSPLDPRHSRRHAGTRRETLISAIADYDPEADDDFSLCALAARLGLSERQTARLIRAETGRSFRELKATARLERAQKLLASSDLPILEVALRAGWNSSSQFHEAFRSSVGVSPARYRAAHRG